MHAQPGIFALGTSDHCYLEFDLTDTAAFLRSAAALVTDLSTTGGVNVVVGLRAELWATLADPDEVPAAARSFDEDLVGPDGFTMPATQHDAWVWISGGDRSAVFDAAVRTVHDAGDVASVRREVGGWLYRHDRDLTGFIDGTENPSLIEASSVVAVPDGEPGAGSSVVLFQLWTHQVEAWTALGVEGQEKVMGRTKADSVEFPDDVKAPDSHVERATFDVDGVEQKIFRRNVAYGGPTANGTVFVGFGRHATLHGMLEQMAGVGDGIRCALTRYTTPISGAYYVVPSVEALARLVPEDDGQDSVPEED
ncbi:Dyp-type peroxidase [Jatrophihabitans endophyticus]|uniref:Dyp-type peroxidase n=1 Tax=Jatrophihabitans endophyticus TaxID=1206085 RepID=UPI0019F91517|nr:Dyp-type peroxidase [Jatrophihabitans endophyticus]MBE7188824.1 Dyp-type peroxidase [Jatrophihabitans endophyticus]